MPKELWELLDFERVRETYFETHQGAYCPSGLVLKRKDAEITEVYKEYLPEPGYDKDALFLVHLYRMHGRPTSNYSFSLPADEEKIEMAKEALQTQDFSDCEMRQFGGPLDRLSVFLPVIRSVDTLNQFAKILKEGGIGESPQNLNKLIAVLEAECPRNMEKAIEVVGNLSLSLIHI